MKKFIAWLETVPSGLFFWQLMSCICAYTGFVLWFDDSYFPKQKFAESNSILAVSVVMSVLFVFRTNSAYDRWWEGRKLWGQLVNDTRNLALKSKNYFQLSQAQQQILEKLLIAFPYALRDHLRGLSPSEKVLPAIQDASSYTHVPLELTARIYKLIASAASENDQKFDLLLVDPHMRSFMDICGACERILKTPIAHTYKEMIWAGLGLNSLILPWLLVPLLDVWSLPIIFVGSYFIYTLELLAEEVEEPFGKRAQDLPLDKICLTIESSVREVLGPKGI